MINVLPLSLGDLADQRIIGILIRSLLITLLIFVILGFGMGWLLDGIDPCGWIGDMECTFDRSASGLGAIALTVLALWFLFPAVALGVICTYIDRITVIIEQRHYPGAAASARATGVAGMAMLGLRSTLRVLIYNLIAAPFYILLLVTGVGTVILFVLVNGLAFGRDLGEMVAARHGDRAARRAWLGASRGGRFLIGTAVTALFLVPFVNLLAPILGAAMTTHLYHQMRRD